MNPKLHLALFLFFISFSVRSQPYQNDSSMLELNTFYNKFFAESSILNLGPVYIVQTYTMAGNPFYKDIDEPLRGWIVYDGHFYNDVALQWDVFQNYVIKPSLTGITRHILNNELIDSFFLDGQLIRNLIADKAHNLQSGGLYAIIHEGNIQAIVRPAKDNIGIIEGMKVKYHFRVKNSYYIRKEGIYYRVSNKKDVLRLFRENRAGIKRELRKEELKWRKDFELCVKSATEYADKAKTTK